MSKIVTDSQRDLEAEKAQHETCQKKLRAERQRSKELAQTLSFIKAQLQSLTGKGIYINPVHLFGEAPRTGGFLQRQPGFEGRLQRNWRHQSTNSSSCGQQAQWQ